MRGRPPRTREQFIAHFWKNVNKSGAIPAHRPKLGRCWEWLGSLDKDGYGRAWPTRNYVRVHRLVWSWKHGAIPHGKWILHHCDNPSCVNDAHLFLGGAKDNSQDALAKGRNYIGAKNPFFGRHHTAKTRRKLSLDHLGKPLSAEHAEKARKAALGKKHSPEARLRHSAAAKRRWAIGGKNAFDL